MAAPKVEIREDDDGGLSLTTDYHGVQVTFATVNPSALAEAAQQQGKSLPTPAEEPGEEGAA